MFQQLVETTLVVKVTQNGKRWATKPTVHHGITIYKGGKCEDCSALHVTDLSFWSWDAACDIFKHATGATRTQLEHAHAKRRIEYKPEHVFTKAMSGYLAHVWPRPSHVRINLACASRRYMFGICRPRPVHAKLIGLMFVAVDILSTWSTPCSRAVAAHPIHI